MTNEESEHTPSQAGAYAIGELSFVLLPFIVMAITFSFKGNLPAIFQEPEWSLLAAIMFGQSIIKMIHLMGKSSLKTSFYSYRIGAVLSIVILIGLVPSLTVLSLVYISEVVPQWLCVTQVLLFLLASITFFLINGMVRSRE